MKRVAGAALIVSSVLWTSYWAAVTFAALVFDGDAGLLLLAVSFLVAGTVAFILGLQLVTRAAGSRRPTR